MEFSGKSHHWLSRDLNLKSKFTFQSDLMASGLPWEYRTPRPGAGRRRRPWRNRKSTFCVVSSLNLSLGLAAYALRLNHRALFWSRFHWHDTFSLSANGKKSRRNSVRVFWRPTGSSNFWWRREKKSIWVPIKKSVKPATSAELHLSHAPQCPSKETGGQVTSQFDLK